MPYFCQNPKCKRHVWFDQRRYMMREAALNDGGMSYSVVQVESQAVVYGRYEYYLCEDCAEKLKNGASIKEILGNHVGSGEVLPDPFRLHQPWMPWW